MRRPTRVLLAAVVLSAGCASMPATRPASVAVPVDPAPTLAEADAALDAGRLDRALWLYERLALDAAIVEDRVVAMERAAFLRASSRHDLRDLSRVQEWTMRRRSMDGSAGRLIELEALEALASELALRHEEVCARLSETAGLQARLARDLADARGRASEVRTLRATNATLRAEVAKLRSEADRLQAELQRKDEALKKIAASIAGGVGDR